MRIFHYTTIDTLALILNSKSIKFSRLDQLDDKLESEPFAVFNPLCYIFSSSFTYDSMESIPMWKMYSNMETGIRIEFDSDKMFTPSLQHLTIPENDHEVCTFPQALFTAIRAEDVINSDYILLNWSCDENDSLCQCIKIKTVSYIDDFKDRYRALLNISDTVENGNISSSIQYKPTEFGYFKSKYWEFQKEVRLLIYATPFPKDKNVLSDMVSGNRPLKTTQIFVPLSDLCLNNLKITLSPKVSLASKLIVKSLLQRFPNTIISNSSLYNTIR